MSNSSTAKIFLRLNAVFSVVTGLALLLMPETIAQMMFVDPGGWKAIILRGLGIGLLIFALDLAVMASNQFITKAIVMLIVIADIGWILTSAIFILFYNFLFTSTGVLTIEIVAVFVAIFAIGQYVGARKIVPPVPKISFHKKQGSLIATVIRKTNVPVSRVWDVMTDHPGYADVASNIAKVEILSGDGLGMIRRCYGPKGENWEETCDSFEEGRSFGFTIHTEAANYPYPFEELKGLWSVEPNGSGSEFSIKLSAKPKGNFIVRALFFPIAKKQFTPVLIDLANAWAMRMERGS